MWIHISEIAKTSIFLHKIKVGKSQNSNPTKYPQVIVENTKNSPNSSSYTIEYKFVRNSHLLSQNWHFLKVPQQLFYKQALIAHTQDYQSSI